MATSLSTAVWHGSLTEGSGQITARSGAFDVPYSLKSRVEELPATNPEELIAAAHSGCFTMMITALLMPTGFTATSIKTSAKVQLDPNPAGGFTITSIKLSTEATIPGMDDAAFQELAANAKANCPVSVALASVPSITLEAKLVD